jgi:hypothetical protein
MILLECRPSSNLGVWDHIETRSRGLRLLNRDAGTELEEIQNIFDSLLVQDNRIFLQPHATYTANGTIREQSFGVKVLRLPRPLSSLTLTQLCMGFHYSGSRYLG